MSAKGELTVEAELASYAAEYRAWPWWKKAGAWLLIWAWS